ncbi:PDZ domain-containing protein [Lentisphaera profundi]|uniref:PDZ domain-containing protein n=1 Tax=Lentisphaera profundi TaxID=1658616 RepID=A0ABY7VQI0_9BACT|nr:PDZ domain-containing protein [Lentisphaera profundi]WDE96455.1 PDZ domain-containing protein [Lentisphaera profundi]
MKIILTTCLLLLFNLQAKKIDVSIFTELQQTVNEISEKNNKGFLYMEITHINKGKTQAIPITGLLMDDNGHLATLYLDQKRFVSCSVWIDEQEYKASYLYSDKLKGFTILKLDGEAPVDKLSPAVFGDPTLLKNGEFLIALTPTNPDFGHIPLVNLCSVAGTLESNRDLIYVNGLSTHRAAGMAPVGMPLLNLEGKIVGLYVGNGVIMTDSFEKGCRNLLEKISKGEDLNDPSDLPWDGFSYKVINQDFSEAMNVSQSSVLVTRVIDESPATKAGLQAGDIITAIDNKPFTRKGRPILSQARKWLDAEIGRSCEINFERNGKKLAGTITFVKRPKSDSISVDELGLTINNITPLDFYAYRLHKKAGVLVSSIEKGSPAATSTYFGRPLISPGDIILEIDHNKISNIHDLRTIINEIRLSKKKEVLIKLLDGSVSKFVSLNTAIGQKTKKADK